MQFPPNDHCGCERLWYVPAFPIYNDIYIEVHGHIHLSIHYLTYRITLYSTGPIRSTLSYIFIQARRRLLNLWNMPSPVPYPPGLNRVKVLYTIPAPSDKAASRQVSSCVLPTRRDRPWSWHGLWRSRRRKLRQVSRHWMARSGPWIEKPANAWRCRINVRNSIIVSPPTWACQSVS